MIDYNYTKAINLEKLQLEISAQNLPVLAISSLGTAITIHMSRTLTGEEETALESIVSAHTTTMTVIQVAALRVDAAMNFGTKLIRDFAAENVSLGITQLGLTRHVRTTLVDVAACLMTGSLYDAIDSLKIVDPNALDAVILTEARLLKFRNKIEDFLQLTRSTAWNQ